MRFKAKISKDNLVALQSVVASLDHISHRAALHLNPDAFKISLIVDSPDMPQCFAEMNAKYLFQDYRIESQSGNAILFEIGLDLFSWALASGKSAEFAQLKLVKRGTKPYLCFEAYAQSVAAIQVQHDIPIRLMPPGNLIYHVPPAAPPPQVALKLPRGKMLRAIIQKLHSFSKTMFLTAKQAGRLVFRVDHAQVTIRSFCNNLTPYYPAHLSRENDAENSATVKLDVRKLSAVLGLGALPWDDACVYVVHNSTVLISVLLPSFGGTGTEGGGAVDFYLPVMLLSADEEGEDEEDGGVDCNGDGDGGREE